MLTDMNAEQQALHKFVTDHAAELTLRVHRLRAQAIEPAGIAIPARFESAKGATWLALPLHRTDGILAPFVMV